MKPIKVGLLGAGTVGAGVFLVLQQNQEEIARRLGREIHIVAIADLDVARAKSVLGSHASVSANAQEVITNPDIDIVIELIGGYGIAKTLVLDAIAAGKHIVTANKALLAVHGTEIFNAAAKQGVMVGFEAAVAGGIPIVKALREGLAANRIDEVAGIINGTTNFILSQMHRKGLAFSAALQEAQRLGYAEADPGFDIEGIDAAHKISLMSALAFGTAVQFDQAYIEGIKFLDPLDIQYAEELGYRIKLLGITKRRPQGVELRVHPTLISEKHLMAHVDGVLNAVWVRGNAVGATLYSGPGAGGEATASAVIADLVDIARRHGCDPQCWIPSLAFQRESLQELTVLPITDVVSGFYLRVRVADEAGVLVRVTQFLADVGISIDAVRQHAAQERNSSVFTDLIILTHQTNFAVLERALVRIQALPSVLASITCLRKEELS